MSARDSEPLHDAPETSAQLCSNAGADGSVARQRRGPSAMVHQHDLVFVQPLGVSGRAGAPGFGQ